MIRLSGIKKSAAVIGAIFALGVLVGTLAVGELCHYGALRPALFNATGQCSASDPPSEVFWSFIVIAVIVLTGLYAAYWVLRLVMRLLSGVMSQ